MSKKRIHIGADHAGFEMKEKLEKWLSKKYNVIDSGAFAYQEGDDYPNFAFLVGESVVRDEGSLGVLICESGNGVCIAANKVFGVRAILGLDVLGAKAGRKDEDANVLCLRAKGVSFEVNKKIINAFLKEKASEADRHKRRQRKINLYHSGL
jgi:ribose 5-phosphate isomerase B